MNRKKIVATTIALATLVAVALGGWLGYGVYQKSVVTKRVLGALVDPDSAKFNDVRYFPKTGAGCGLVNAKNRMGGYTGFTEFVAESSGKVTFAPRDALESAPVAERLEAAQQRLAFLRMAVEVCPDESSS
jgi:hypothetical protein